jgi:erythromycin esterase-like protein
MTALETRLAAHVVRDSAHALTGAPADFDPLMTIVGDAHTVLIGEASHGTHEFYRIRGEITKRLVREKGFTAVAVEADWPDAYRVNRFVRGMSADSDAGSALDGFRRFPQWMWRNADVLDFVGWLRAFNDRRPAERKAGFYGLDLYSLHASMQAVLRYLDLVDPPAAIRARHRYACMGPPDTDPKAWGYAASLRLTPTCEREVVGLLVELRASADTYARRDGRVAADDLFFAEQNAILVKNAERYYRTMFQGHVESWNVRDRHMAEMLDRLTTHLHTQVAEPRVVVWAHNSHLGDSRATEMGRHGELNVGRLVRERAGTDAVLIGFTTYDGTVTAASDWDEPAERKTVRPALAGSFEALFHGTGIPNFLLDLAGSRIGRVHGELAEVLEEPRLERAIGVVYRPDTERLSHYFQARLANQFDAVLHYDRTRAVEPIERTGEWERGELPETFPSAL